MLKKIILVFSALFVMTIGLSYANPVSLYHVGTGSYWMDWDDEIISSPTGSDWHCYGLVRAYGSSVYAQCEASLDGASVQGVAGQYREDTASYDVYDLGNPLQYIYLYVYLEVTYSGDWGSATAGANRLDE